LLLRYIRKHGELDYLFIALVTVLIFARTGSHGVIAPGDAGTSIFPSELLKKSFSLWNAQDLGHARLPRDTLLLIFASTLESLGLPLWAINRAFFFLPMLVLGWGSCYLVNTILGQGSRLPSIISTLFLMLNPYTSYKLIAGVPLSLFAIGFMMLQLAFLIKGLRSSQKIYALLIGLCSVMVAIDVPFLVLEVIMFFFYILYALVTRESPLRRAMKFVFCVFLFVILMNLYLLIPGIYLQSKYNYISTAIYGGRAWTVLRYTESLTSLTNSARLLYGAEPENNLPLPLFSSFVIIGIAYSSLFSKRYKIKFYFVLTAILFTGLSTGIRYPLIGDLYLLLFKNFPIFNIFRAPNKFFAPLSICYTSLVGIALKEANPAKIWLKNKTRYLIYLKVLLPLFCIFLILLNSHILIWGVASANGAVRYMPIDVPSYYFQLKEYFDSAPDGRDRALLLQQLFGIVQPSWTPRHYDMINPIPEFVSRPIVSTDCLAFLPFDKNIDNIQNFLGFFGIRYVILQRDLMGFEDQVDQLSRYLDMSGLPRKDLGNISIYQINGRYVLPHIYGSIRPILEKPSSIYDDNETFWIVDKGGLGRGSFDISMNEETEIVANGSSSLRINIINGSYPWGGIIHHYSPPKDLSSKAFISFYWFGVNNGEIWRLVIQTISGMCEYHFIDHFSGWKQLTFFLSNPNRWGGSPDLRRVTDIYFYTIPATTMTTYLDQVLVYDKPWDLFMMERARGSRYVIYLPFDEETGMVTQDYSSCWNDGTLYNFNGTDNSGWVDSKYDKALAFDGVDDYVKVADSITLRLTDAITMEAWIKPNDPEQNGIIIQKGDSVEVVGYRLEIVGGKIGFWFLPAPGEWYGGLEPTASITPGWHHIVVTYDGKNIKMYNDAKLRHYINCTKPLPKENYCLQIGARLYSGELGYFYNGTIDEVRIYNRALTAEEILTLYESSYPTETNLSLSGAESELMPVVINSPTADITNYYTSEFGAINLKAEKISNSKYIVHVNTTTPFFLVLSESYSAEWGLYYGELGYFGAVLSDEHSNHFVVNHYANGWYLDKVGNYKVTILFRPQMLYDVSLLISITSLVIGMCYLFVQIIERLREYGKMSREPADGFKIGIRENQGDLVSRVRGERWEKLKFDKTLDELEERDPSYYRTRELRERKS